MNFSGVENPSCGRAISVSSYKNLERHCDDCYNVFRDIDLYQMCRQDCYENDMYFICLNVLQVPQDEQHSLVNQIAAVDGGDVIGYVSK